jgi:hypothetical protein
MKYLDIIEAQNTNIINKDHEIMKKIDTMESNIIKKNEETLTKIENLVQTLSQNSNERQNPPLRRTNSFDDVKQLMKPINNIKRKRKPKANKPSLKDKEGLKMKITRAAETCKKIEDLKSMLEILLNENNHLEYGNAEIKLDMNKDALDQMTEQNCFPPIDQWRCPICFEEIDLVEDDEQSQWECHLNLKHNIGNYLFENIYPFIIYIEVHPHYCYFSEEQDINTTVINEFKGDWDIDEKCPLAMYSTHAGFEERLKEHINNRHRNYKAQSKIKLPPFWKYLKINTPDTPTPNFFDFLNVTKHPWLNYKIFKRTHSCGLITTIKYQHGNHYYTWIEGSMALYFITIFENILKQNGKLQE